MKLHLFSIVSVAIGGAIGSVLRYIMTTIINKSFFASFPTATFTINIIGCLIIGLIAGMVDTKLVINPYVKLLLITGFCGGFTTFSTFSLENITLLQNHHITLALLYISGSLILGIITTIIGLYIGKLL